MFRASMFGRALLGAALLFSAGWAAAQAYPSKPVRILVGYAAGGPVDNAVRRILPALQKELGQTIVIENRGGAGGVVAAEAVAKAEPDGYTLIFMASPTQVMTPHMMKSMPFDPVKGLTPIGAAVGFATALLVNQNFSARTVEQLIAFARDNPGKVSFGSAGVGSSNHLAGELLKKHSATNMVHVAYKGNAPALNDVMSGQVTFMFSSVGDSLSLITSGKVRALAVSSAQRSRVLPNVPTMGEAGLANFDVTAWYALEGPPRLPRAIVDRLNAALRNALADPAVLKGFADIGYDVIPSSPEELAARIQADYERWSTVAREFKVE